MTHEFRIQKENTNTLYRLQPSEDGYEMVTLNGDTDEVLATNKIDVSTEEEALIIFNSFESTIT
jgi:hypothetical protein